MGDGFLRLGADKGKRAIKRLAGFLAGETPQKRYQRWYDRHRASKEDLEAQRAASLSPAPKISILVPVYDTPVQLLREMIDSVIAQSYPNWELCVGDGSPENKELEAVLSAYHSRDPRIRYRVLEKNGGISGNTNEALALASGEFVGLLDHDDLLAPDALYHVARMLRDPRTDVVYTDEDKIYGRRRRHREPYFKPDFSIDLLRSQNYIAHFFVARRSIVEQVGGFRSAYDGSQDYDLILRCVEKARGIVHVPRILYHWRMTAVSTAQDPASKMYCYEAGRRAIQDHLDRVGVKGNVEHAGIWGAYHVVYDTAPHPLVSIIIPNRDGGETLNACVRSVVEKSTYRNFEFVVVDRESGRKENADRYKDLRRETDRVKVVYMEGDPGVSAMINFGVERAEGEYLLLLRGDMELLLADSISDMLGVCMRKETGAAGAGILSAEGTVAHAGMVIGPGGQTGRVFSGIGADDYGYMARARISCDYSAVSGACLMTKRSVFEEAGGFSEAFSDGRNSVDYCMKVRETGLLVVYDAFARWRSRGNGDVWNDQKDPGQEADRFCEKWKKTLEEGDPYFNKNLRDGFASFADNRKIGCTLGQNIV